MKTKEPYRPLSNSGYTYDAVHRRMSSPTQTRTQPYNDPGYGVKHTGQSTTFTNKYEPTQGQSIKSPVTGREIGMSQWGKPLTGQISPEQYGTVLNQNPEITRLINDEMKRYFGSASQVQLVDLVNKIVNEGMPIDEALQLMQSGHRRSEDEIRASSLVAGEYDPAISALDRELDRIARQLGIDINTQEAFGDKYGERLAGIGGQLARDLEGNRDAIEQLYAQARQQTGQAYTQADEKMSQANAMIQQIIGESANQLGVGGAEGRSFSELAQALADSQGINAAGRAGAIGNFSNLGADMTAVAQQSVSDSQREFAQKQEQLINEVMRNIAGLQYQGATQQNEIGGQISDLERQRAADLRNTLLEVRDSRLDRERQTALDALAAEIQRGTLGLQQQQLGQNAQQFDQTMNFNRDQFEFDKQIRQAQLNMEMQRLQAELSATSDPLEQAYLQAQIDRLNSQTQETLHDLANPNAGGQKYKGLEGVRQYLSDNYTAVPASPTADDKYFSTFQDLWNQALQQSAGDTASADALFQGILANQPMTNFEKNIYQTLAMIMNNQYSSF